MKRYGIIACLISLILVIGILNGCDNRSQLEKDADAAAKKVSDSLR